MIPIGDSYRPAGFAEPKSILITLILGVTAAVLGAALVWGWEWSGVPTLVLITPLLQGVGVGSVMAFAIGRLRIRNPRLVGLVGFTCGLLSAVLVHYGHYIHLVTAATESIRQEIRDDAEIAPDAKQKIIAKLDEDPASFLDATLKARTGYSGFLGSLALRAEDGVRIKSTNLTGIGVYILWAVEAIAVGCIAASVPAARAGLPFCEECGYWCEKHADVLTLPPHMSEELAGVMKEDRVKDLAALREKAPVGLPGGQASVALHSCPGCDVSYADVSHTFTAGKEKKTSVLLKTVRVSPAMIAAIRVPPAPEPTPEDPATEAAVEPGADVDEPPMEV